MRKLLGWACWHVVMKWWPWLPKGHVWYWALGWAGWYAQGSGCVYIFDKDEI